MMMVLPMSVMMTAMPARQTSGILGWYRWSWNYDSRMAENHNEVDEYNVDYGNTA